jgi:hypothetical protein
VHRQTTGDAGIRSVSHGQELGLSQVGEAHAHGYRHIRRPVLAFCLWRLYLSGARRLRRPSRLDASAQRGTARGRSGARTGPHTDARLNWQLLRGLEGMVQLRSACASLRTQMLLLGWAVRHRSRTTKRRGRRLLALARACRRSWGSSGAIIIVCDVRWVRWLARATSRQRSCSRAGAPGSSSCAPATSREVELAAGDRARDHVVRARCSLCG